MSVRVAELPTQMRCWPSYQDWCRWVERHGVDRMEALLPNRIVADDDARTVSIRAIVRDDRGNTMAGEVDVVVQLESPALPFPEVFS